MVHFWLFLSACFCDRYFQCWRHPQWHLFSEDIFQGDASHVLLIVHSPQLMVIGLETRLTLIPRSFSDFSPFTWSKEKAFVNCSNALSNAEAKDSEFWYILQMWQQSKRPQANFLLFACCLSLVLFLQNSCGSMENCWPFPGHNNLNLCSSGFRVVAFTCCYYCSWLTSLHFLIRCLWTRRWSVGTESGCLLSKRPKCQKWSRRWRQKQKSSQQSKRHESTANQFLSSH